MQSFAYNSPTKLHFGVGVGAVADHMADELTSSGCKTALVVTGGGSVRRNGAHDAVLKALEAAGVRAVEISGIEPNPRVTSVERATALCRAEGVDLVVAVGGGSTMDASKAICAAAGHDGPAWDLVLDNSLVTDALPLMTVNTIAAHCEVEVDMRSVSNEELLKLEARVLKAFEEAVQEENDFWGITDESLKLKLTKTQIGNRPAGMRPDDCPVLQTARSAQKVLGIELTKYMCSSTDANAPMSLGIPSTCLCSGGRGVNAHSVTEYFEKVDTQLGPQLVFLTAAALVGACGEKPVLPVRK